MVAQILALLESLFNLVIDTIYKIGVTLLVLVLCAIALAFGFVLLIVQLVT